MRTKRTEIVGRKTSYEETGGQKQLGLPRMRRVVTRELACGHFQREPNGGGAEHATEAFCPVCYPKAKMLNVRNPDPYVRKPLDRDAMDEGVSQIVGVGERYPRGDAGEELSTWGTGAAQGEEKPLKLAPSGNSGPWEGE